MQMFLTYNPVGSENMAKRQQTDTFGITNTAMKLHASSSKHYFSETATKTYN